MLWELQVPSKSLEEDILCAAACSLGLQALWFEEGNSWLLGLLGKPQKMEVLTTDKLLLDCETKHSVHRLKIAVFI